MKFTKREIEFGFASLAEAILNNKNSKFNILFPGYIEEEFKFKTTYLTNNKLDVNHPAYEEFNVIELKGIGKKDKNFIASYPISYHTLPLMVEVDDEIIFDIERCSIKDNPIEEKEIINLEPTSEGLISAPTLKDGSFFTDTILDEDSELRKINRAYLDLLDEASNKEINNEEFDEKIFKNNLINLSVRFKNRVNDLNDGSFIVNDYLPSYEDTLENKEDEIFKFRKKDTVSVDLGNASNLLNLGIKAYNKGYYETSFPFILVSSLLQNPEAITKLGDSFMFGRGVEKNEDVALVCYKIAAKDDEVEACYKIAEIHRFNKEYLNLDLAKLYYVKAVTSLFIETLADYPNLAYSLAKEKLDDGIFSKDIYGAYFLLLFALDGYKLKKEADINDDLNKLEEVQNLLSSHIFDECKIKYPDDYYKSYRFSEHPFDENLNCPIGFYKTGDEVYLNFDFEDEGTYIHAGSIGTIVSRDDDEALVNFKEQNKKVFVPHCDLVKKED